MVQIVEDLLCAKFLILNNDDDDDDYIKLTRLQILWHSYRWVHPLEFRQGFSSVDQYRKMEVTSIRFPDETTKGNSFYLVRGILTPGT